MIKIKPIIKKFLILLVIVFILNLIWEYLHFPLYYDLTGISKHPHLWLATITDLVWITLLFLIISWNNNSMAWITNPKKLDYLLLIILGILPQIVTETHALYVGKWMYKAAMPTVFSIGLSPLLQLFTTAILGLFILRKFVIKK